MCVIVMAAPQGEWEPKSAFEKADSHSSACDFEK